jgi:integrase
MGRVFRAQIKYRKADGTLVDKLSDAWYIQFTDSSGRCVRRKAGLTQEQAKDALIKAESDVLNEKNGLPTIRATEISVEELMKPYLVALQRRTSEYHSTKTAGHIRKILTATKAAIIRDLTPDKVESYLADLQERGLAPNTINQPLIAIKAFLNWAVTTRRLPYNHLACVKRVHGPPTRRRRPLTEEEIGRLLAAALEGPLRRRKRSRQNRPRKDGTYKEVIIYPALLARLASDGRNAALAYRLMIEAGLRRNEAASVQWGDVDLNANILRLRGEITKNGKSEELPLTRGLHEALKQRKEELNPKPQSAIVNMSCRVLKCFYDDLVAAGLARKIPLDKNNRPIPLNAHGRPMRKPKRWKFDTTDESGRVIDLHALRHTCGTRLLNSGADIKTVQSMMRHATAAFTLAVYVHSDTKRMAAAVAALPELVCSQRGPVLIP